MSRTELARLVSVPLRVGTVLAVLLIAVGMLLGLGDGGTTGSSGEPLIKTISAGGWPALISLGLLLLTLVPIAVTTGAVIGFARGGERRYLVASAVVAVLLMASLAVPVLLLGGSI